MHSFGRPKVLSWGLKNPKKLPSIPPLVLVGWSRRLASTLIAASLFGFSAAFFNVGYCQQLSNDELLQREQQIRYLITQLTNPNSAEAANAAHVLSKLGPSVVPYLQVALKNNDENLRAAVADLFGQLGEAASAAVPDLDQALQDKADPVRANAAKAVARIGPAARETVPTLITLALNDNSAEVRGNAIEALGTMPAPARDLITALARSCTDSNEKVRISATKALGKLGPFAKEAAPALILASADADSADVRANAVEALGTIAGPPKEIIAALKTALQDDNERVRLNAVYAFGALRTSVTEVIPIVAVALNDSSEQVRLGATDVLANAAEQMEDEHETSLIATLKTNLNAVDNVSPKNAGRLRRSVRALEAMKAASWLNRFLSLNKKWLTLVAIVVLYPLGFCVLRFVVLRRWPLHVLAWNDALQPYTDLKLPDKMGGLQVPLRNLLLIGLVRYHPIVLDAWIYKYVNAARENFQNRDIYRDRKTYISLPVMIGSNVNLSLSAGSLHPITRQDRWCIRILGEGGVGKTTLACQIALWAMEADETKRVIPDRQMLPVLIEPVIGFDFQKDIATFKKVIRGCLQDIIGLPTQISDPLFDQLLQTRRILTILDGFSEMPTSSILIDENRASPTNPDFPARALLITSRSEESLAQASHYTIYPQRIDRDHLSKFMTAYLTESGHNLADPNLFDACRRLASMVEAERGITPLLAKLFAAEVVGALEGRMTLQELPQTIPDLMLDYLNHLNRHRTKSEPDDEALHRAAKLVAWECVKHSFRPGPARKSDISAILDKDQKEPLSREILLYMEEKLRLINTLSPAKTDLQFALDPLAEYIAAMHLIEMTDGNDQQWKDFLAATVRIPGAPETIKGFLLALRDCCLTKGGSNEVPAFVIGQLSERLAFLEENDRTTTGT